MAEPFFGIAAFESAPETQPLEVYILTIDAARSYARLLENSWWGLLLG